jgi:hypothetical protein
MNCRITIIAIRSAGGIYPTLTGAGARRKTYILLVVIAVMISIKIPAGWCVY